MNVVRNELRTGLLALVTLGVFAAALLYLAAPGTIRKMAYYHIYFDDAGGIQPGSPVMLAGRRVGQVVRLRSPVPDSERPRPNLEAAVEVEITLGSQVFRNARATMLQYGLLGEQVINFANGSESAGLATANTRFVGERQPGLNEAAPMLVQKMDPAIKTATQALDELRTAARQINALTSPDGDFASTLTNLKAVTDNLSELSGSGGALHQSMEHLRELTGNDGPLAVTWNNAKTFTGKLAGNEDLTASLHNFRQASQGLEQTVTGLKGTVRSVGPGLRQTVHNATQFTDTVKHQPWRLIWPVTKKYPEDQPSPSAIAERRDGRGRTVPARTRADHRPKATPTPKPARPPAVTPTPAPKPTPSPTPAPYSK